MLHLDVSLLATVLATVSSDPWDIGPNVALRAPDVGDADVAIFGPELEGGFHTCEAAHTLVKFLCSTGLMTALTHSYRASLDLSWSSYSMNVGKNISNAHPFPNAATCSPEAVRT